MALPAAVSSTNDLPVLTLYFKSACYQVKKRLFIEKKYQEVIKSQKEEQQGKKDTGSA